MSVAQLPDIQSQDDLLRIIAQGQRPACNNALAQLRELLGFTQKTASEHSGIHAGTLSHYENDWWPSEERLIKYLEVLGADPDTLEKYLKATKRAQMLASLNSAQLADGLDQIIRMEAGTGDLHELQRLAFSIGVPKTICALLIKASEGDVPAAKLVREWWKEWEREDVARSINTTSDRSSSTTWVAQSVGVATPASTPEVVTPQVTHAGDAANTGESSDS